jgi:hypothetical protein
MYAVVAGTPVDGITVYGPFTTIEDAEDWAERAQKYVEGETYVVDLVGPASVR